jgi:hypothetical protein
MEGEAMASPEQEHMWTCINATPPQEDVTLVGYVVMAEWQEADGQRVLTRLVGDHAPAWVAKGYLHEGLYASWPLDSVRHNPGHSGHWMTVGQAAKLD